MLPLQTTELADSLANKISADSLREGSSKLVDTLSNSTPSEILHLLGQQAISFGLKVLGALIIYILGAWLIRKVKKLMEKVFDRKGADPALRSFLNSLVSVAMWTILIILTVSALGVNTSSLAALLAAGGMAIGMALSGTVQNFAGGIMLLIFKPFRAGDYIEALGYSGTVQEINIVSTKLVTIDNRIIILPNGALSSGNINNITALPLRRIDQSITVEYGSDADEVRSAILDIIRANPLFLDSSTEGAQDPFVGLKSLNDSNVEFITRVWVKKEDYWNAWFYLNETVYREFPKKGIKFPFPQLDVHLQK